MSQYMVYTGHGHEHLVEAESAEEAGRMIEAEYRAQAQRPNGDLQGPHPMRIEAVEDEEAGAANGRSKRQGANGDDQGAKDAITTG